MVNEVVDTVAALFKETNAEGYPYSAGYWEAAVMSLVFNYVPVANRASLVEDLESRIKTLKQQKESV
jgi:hypothetical protein